MTTQEQSLVATDPKAVPAEWEEVRSDPTALFRRVSRMLVNGKNLTKDEAFALVDYSITNDLNPLIGEAYVLPGVGCVPGDAGWKRKASEQMWMELREAGVTDGGFYHIDYYPATHDEALFKEEEGDIAWKAVLYDSLSVAKWRQLVNECGAELKASFPEESFLDIMKMAREMIGKKPEWWAVGVVDGEEAFSKFKDYNDHSKGRKPEMWDRNERAKKRARKQVLRSRFPNVRLPSMRFTDEHGEPIYIADGEIDEPDVSVTRPSREEAEEFAGLFDYGDQHDKPEKIRVKEWGFLNDYTDIAEADNVTMGGLQFACEGLGLKEESGPALIRGLLATYADYVTHGKLQPQEAIDQIKEDNRL